MFGLIHVTPSQGLGNVGIMLGVGVFGLVLGLAARHFRRLGPTIVGHAVFNAAAVIPLLLPVAGGPIRAVQSGVSRPQPASNDPDPSWVSSDAEMNCT